MSGFAAIGPTAIGLAVAAGLAFGVSGFAFAQEGKSAEAAVRASMSEAVVTPPSDPVAKAAFDVLEKHCSRCHQQGKLVERERPAKNFGNILKLEEICLELALRPSRKSAWLEAVQTDCRQGDAVRHQLRRRDKISERVGS